MFAYSVKKFISGTIVLFLVSLSVFLLFWFAPINPAQPLCDRQTSNRCGDRITTYEEMLGYDNTWYSEYGVWLKGVFVGRDFQFVPGEEPEDCAAPCLGLSYLTSVPVYEELKERLPATVSVALGGAFLYVLLGIPIGIISARKRGSLLDKSLVSSFLFLSSVPYYLFALLTWLYFTVRFEVPFLSDTGYFPITESPTKWFFGLLLAWICLGIFGCTSYARYMRGSMVESLSEDYVRTARAKGLTERVVVMRHALRSALVPVVTIFGLDLGILLAGTIFTERIFEIKGIGWWGLEAVYAKDLPVVTATVLFGAAMIIVSNFVVDLLYSVLDPRVRIS
jgi:peptide/nickel transport system permease protein